MPVGLSPRYYLGVGGDARLVDRQTGECNADQHPCLDVGASVCCENTEYCIVGNNFIASCCPIGSDCGLTACDTLHYLCAATATISGTPTASASCCARSCPSTSAYKCAAAYGGGCCSFDSSCSSNNVCVSTIATTSQSALVSEVPSGCTTNQIACPTSLGGGCCDNTLSCTVVSDTNYCAAPAGTAVRTGMNGILETAQASQSSGLSTGAKAGIGAGLGVAALLVISLLLWFCIIHRRHARQSQAAPSSTQAMSQVSGSEAMKPPAPDRQAADYFGPAATAGPFTSDLVSPMSPGSIGGVPLSPQSPGDIQVPVEIDSRAHSNTQSNATSPGYSEYMRSPGAAEQPVELP